MRKNIKKWQMQSTTELRDAMNKMVDKLSHESPSSDSRDVSFSEISSFFSEFSQNFTRCDKFRDINKEAG